jgi:hypothetical protein
MKTKILILFLISILTWSVQLESKPRVTVINPDNGFVLSGPGIVDNNAVIQEFVLLTANRIKSYVINTGIFDQNIETVNTPGFEWPKNNEQHANAIFTAGLTIAAKIDGNLKMAAASYSGEWSPGYAIDGQEFTDSRFKLYSIFSTDNANNNPDYANWGEMVPFGAPYVDENNNGVYDPGTDIPGVKNASQTIFICLTDGFQDQHSVGEGFGGGTLPMYAQMQMTAWAYNISGIEDMQFLRFVVTNKNTIAWDSTFFGVVVDPDLGDATDDWIGCDTANNMAFCYNSDNDDGGGGAGTYGANPPASGMDFFVSPVNRNVNPPDTLGLTSFVYFINTNTPGATCERDPNDPIEAYRYLQGRKSDGTSWVDPTQIPPKKTVFTFPGDPETNDGWTETKGRIDNCGSDSTGAIISPNPGGDRRFIFNSGSTSFRMNPGDSQVVVLAQFVARGDNNLKSVTTLKRLDQTAQKLFDADFNVIPPPSTPISTHSIQRVGGETSSFVNLTLSWQANAENYRFWDSVFAPPDTMNIYEFQGYEIYEVKKSAGTLPDFSVPSTINNDLTLLAIFDKIDGVGIIQDSLSLGISVNGQEQYGYFQVVPPYSYTTPSGFPNSGLFRSLQITKTNYPNEYGGNSQLIYGQEYKYIIVAYAYSPSAPRGLHVQRSPLTSFSVIPTAPVAGTQTNYTNGDTLNTNRRDLGVAPVILDANSLIDATYRVQFNSPDTTYNIMRSTDGGAFSNIAQNVTISSGARNFDGVEFGVNKITKTGVIRDTIENPAVNQSRQYGWSYEPAGNRFVEGSKNVLSNDRPYQSQLMALSWPTQGTYTNLASLVTATGLRNVEIEFTGTGGAGQMAYRYRINTAINYAYQDFVEVPFRAYEVDPTDSTGATRRQINVAFLVADSTTTTWSPTADSLGGRIVTYFFRSTYSSTPDPFYTSKNLFLQQSQTDIYYVWSPKLISPGATYTVGDKMGIYPYMITRPFIEPGFPLYYQFTVSGTTVSNQVAVSRNDLEKIRAVPNPYLGFNVLETSSSNRFITFRRLPEVCTIKIYTLNGDLIKTIGKDNTTSDQQWNLRTFEDVPVASGMYIALIDAPGIGQKIIKLAIFTGQERADF